MEKGPALHISALRIRVLWIAKLLGLFRLSRWLTGRRVRVLCYHAFDDELCEFRPFVFMRPAVFRARLQCLMDRGFQVVTLEEAREAVRLRSGRRNLVVITFDDGWRSIVEKAVPILESFRVPATVYVATQYVQSQTPVFDVAMGYCDWLAQRQGAPSRALGPAIAAALDSQVGALASMSRELRFENAIRSIERESAEFQKKVLQQAASFAGPAASQALVSGVFHYASEQELASLQARGCSLQLHTHAHCLPDGARYAVAEQVELNRRVLSPLVSGPLTHFCYPSGYYTVEHLPVLAAVGIETATTTKPGLWDERTALLEIPRFVDADHYPLVSFEAEMSGFMEVLRMLRRGIGVLKSSVASIRRRAGSRDKTAAPLIVECFYSFQIGGSERVAADLCLEFRKRGYRVLALSMYDKEGPVRTQLEREGIRCMGLDIHGKSWLGRRFLPVAFWRLLLREKPQVVHFQHALTLNFGGWAARLARVPRIVMSEHTEEQFERMSRYRRMSARNFACADKVTAIHAGISNYMIQRMGLKPGKSVVVPNGVPMPAQRDRQSLRAEIGVDKDAVLLVYLGRLHIDKDVDGLLAAFAELRRGRSAVRLMIIGDGDEMTALQEQARALGIADAVLFLGARMDGRELLPAADFLVLNSKTEGLPMVLLEAMACGLPCIGTDVGAIKDVLGDDSGIVVPPGDRTALINALILLAESPSTRIRMGNAARERAERRFSLSAAVDQYLSCFNLPARIP